MTENERLELLKMDLQYPAVEDRFLAHLMQVGEGLMAREGIELTDSVEDNGLRIQYAAYLYRKRAAEDVAMPRCLRWALNNRLFGQKGAAK